MRLSAKREHGAIVASARWMMFHAQGFGRRLMFEVEALAVERGFAKVSSSVDSSQTRLLEHYLRLGGVFEHNSES